MTTFIFLKKNHKDWRNSPALDSTCYSTRGVGFTSFIHTRLLTITCHVISRKSDSVRQPLAQAHRQWAQILRGIVFLRVSIAVVKKSFPKATCGGSWWFHLHLVSSSLGEAKGGTQRSYLEADTEGEARQEHYLLSSTHDLLSMISYSFWNHQGTKSSTVTCAFPHQSLIKNTHPRFVHRPIWWGYFLIRRALLSNDCSLSQMILISHECYKCP